MFNWLCAALLIASFAGNPVDLYWDSEDYPVRTGYFEGKLLRFVPLATSDPQVAKILDRYATFNYAYEPVDWAPALACALTKDGTNGVTSDCYILNSGQLFVFDTEPGEPDYTPFWRAHWLQWVPGKGTGPVLSEQDILDRIAAGQLIQTRPDFVLDATIVMNTSGEVIKQGWGLGPYCAWSRIELPIFAVYYTRQCCEPPPQLPNAFVAPGIGNMVTVQWMLLTDASDLDLAFTTGANYAPRIAEAGEAPPCCNNAYGFVNPAPGEPQLAPDQLPVIDAFKYYRFPDGLYYHFHEWVQANRNYNPIKCWTLLSWNAGVAGSQTGSVKNHYYIQRLISAGKINVIPTADPIVTNSPIVSRFNMIPG